MSSADPLLVAGARHTCMIVAILRGAGMDNDPILGLSHMALAPVASIPRTPPLMSAPLETKHSPDATLPCPFPSSIKIDALLYIFLGYTSFCFYIMFHVV